MFCIFSLYKQACDGGIINLKLHFWKEDFFYLNLFREENFFFFLLRLGRLQTWTLVKSVGIYFMFSATCWLFIFKNLRNVLEENCCLVLYTLSIIFSRYGIHRSLIDHLGWVVTSLVGRRQIIRIIMQARVHVCELVCRFMLQN